MNKLVYEHKKGEKINKCAVSFCLYKSSKFDYNKHILPFENFLQDQEHSDYDILLFYKDEEDLTDIILNSRARLFKVTSDEQNYSKHLWRYLGCNEDYEWVWFRGTDTPKIPKREINLQLTAHYSGCDVVVWSSQNISCLGKFCINKRASKNLIDYLRNFDISESLYNTWDCDERILSSWVDSGNQRILLAVDASTLLNPHQEDWAIKRLRYGHHTVIVKDRDDRNINKTV